MARGNHRVFRHRRKDAVELLGQPLLAKVAAAHRTGKKQIARHQQGRARARGMGANEIAIMCRTMARRAKSRHLKMAKNVHGSLAQRLGARRSRTFGYKGTGRTESLERLAQSTGMLSLDMGEKNRVDFFTTGGQTRCNDEKFAPASNSRPLLAPRSVTR